MREGNFGLRHSIANLSIRSKVGAGFLVVLVLLAISSAAAWLAFAAVAGSVAGYSELVSNSATYRDIDKTVAQYRGHVREYTYSGNTVTADAARREGETIRELIAGGLTRVRNPERHALLESMAKQAESYTANFAHLSEMKAEQTRLETSVIDVAGQQLTDGSTSIIQAANAAGNTDLARLGVETRLLTLLSRLDANKRLGRHIESAGRSANDNLDALRHGVQSLDAATKGSEVNATVAAEAKLVDTYQSAFQRAASLDAEQVALISGVMRETGDALEANANKAKDSNLASQAAIQKETLATTDRGGELVVVFGLCAVASGVVLAWLIGRGISRPVVRMCAAMRALAAGDKSVEIPGVGRKDEVGQMADTVQVFKDGMIEAERLRGANERQRAQAETDRKTGMLKLADNFEASIKGVVNSVASQSTEMQSSAQAMSHTADEATQRATAVAASVQQASTSVQTVATAAEELSASVQEISRQVDQSSRIAGQAVSEAERSNQTVEALDRAAQRIGEVVQLIETIAGQTNLLALNATIEAARAGDAGKGFAVVASEVKSLASQTAKATEEIRGQIGAIQGATHETVEAIRTIGATIRQMSEIATAIASAVEQQGAATREIASNVQQAAQGTNEIAGNIEGVSRVATETGSAATQVLSAAGELSRQSETLRRDVDTFLATVRAA
jgi:methyl-accepting chemotaxis protein